MSFSSSNLALGGVQKKNEWNGTLALGQAIIKTVLNNQGKTG
jgi:hypothetical protein